MTAKVRLGWDEDSIVAPALARDLEAAGIALVTVHGRTTVQRFKGCANWDAIGEVVAAVRGIPVIGNGDVIGPDDAVRLVRHTGCAGVMIARSAIRRPWVFRQADAALRLATLGGPSSEVDEADRIRWEAARAEPTLLEKIRTIRRHIDLCASHLDVRAAAELMRQRISWYGKSMGHVKPLKESIRTAADLESMQTAVDDWIEWAAQDPDASTMPMASRGAGPRRDAKPSTP